MLKVLCYGLFVSLWLYSHLDLGRFFSILIIYTVGRTPWTVDQPVARPLPALRTTQIQNKGTQHPCLERDSNSLAKTVHALDRMTIVIGYVLSWDNSLNSKIVCLL
jgi:hypothetical protein